MSVEGLLPAARLAERVGAPPPAGDAAHRTFRGLTTLASAGPDEISFVSAEKYVAEAAATRAGLLLCPQKLRDAVAGALPAGAAPIVLPVANIWRAVVQVLEFFHPAPRASGAIHDTALVDPSARLASPVDIDAYAIVEADARLAAGCIVGAAAHVGRGVILGEGTHILPRTYLHDGTVVGARCIIGPGAVIGSAGFKYEPIDGVLTHIPQIGRVVIEDDVHIGANTTIDRASFDETRIGARTKIDNLVQVGHNVVVGPDCILCGQAGIAGSTRLGRGVIMAGQVGAADNISICDGAVFMAQAGIPADVTEAGAYFGTPILPYKQAYRNFGLVNQIGDLKKRLAALEKKIGDG